MTYMITHYFYLITPFDRVAIRKDSRKPWYEVQIQERVKHGSWLRTPINGKKKSVFFESISDCLKWLKPIVPVGIDEFQKESKEITHSSEIRVILVHKNPSWFVNVEQIKEDGKNWIRSHSSLAYDEERRARIFYAEAIEKFLTPLVGSVESDR